MWRIYRRGWRRGTLKKKIVVSLLCIALTVGVLSGCVEEKKGPVASFTYSPTTVYVNTTAVTFTDTSTDEDGTIASWEWDLGDGTTATTQNVTHTYSTVATVTVTLTVTDNDGTNDTTTQSITVSYTPPTAAFTYDPMVNITVNTTITFTDNSTKGDANITSWLWDFGDDNTSNATNPTHQYAAIGDYTVTLTVTDANDETDTSDEVVIEVTETT